MKAVRRLSVAGLAVLLCGTALVAVASARTFAPLGRWDLTLRTPEGPRPSWIEVARGARGLTLRYQGAWGAPQDVERVQWDGDELAFTVDQPRGPWRVFHARFNGHWLSGTAADDRGRQVAWSAVRVPPATAKPRVRWGEPIALFDGRDLAGWRQRHPGTPPCWVVRDGRLCALGGDDLVSTRRFRDFRLHVVCRVPEGGDSGIHLRGRYEIQIKPQAGEEAWAGLHASLYGFIPARGARTRMPEDDDVFDITLVGRRLTVDLNGTRVIDDAEVPGITGDALDSDEGAPGPLVLQGYLGPAAFREVVLTPAR